MAINLLYILIPIAIILLILIFYLLKKKPSLVGVKVKEMMNQGKGIKDVLEFARLKKLNEREVKLYFLLYNFQNFLSKGYKLEEIKSMAEDNGWSKDIIEIVARKLK